MIKAVDYAIILSKEEVCTLQANRTYRDSVFTSYFSDKDKLIELYNAIEDTNYGNDTEVVINTLEDVLFMDRRNDISFTIDGKFVILIEHQTTVNQNMPLRCLMYVARLYEKIIDSKSVYKENLIKIPTPEFIVLYNGNKKQPEEQILKLSDAFIEKSDIKLELITKVININYGKSKILKKSKNLNEYSYFIYLIQKNLKNGQPLNEAIKNAVEECIKQGMMRDFLEKNSSEVINMLYTAFDIDVAKEVWQDEARQEGLREGEQKGRSEGLREGEQKGRLEGLREIAKSLLDVLDVKVISQKTGLSVEEIEKLK